MKIRSIKPEWLDDELMSSASSDARVLSVGLILLADDYGHGRIVPAAKVRIFPGDMTGATFDDALRELEPWFVKLYEVRGQLYYELINWNRHQYLPRKAKPKSPLPEEGEYVDSADVLERHAGRTRVARDSHETDMRMTRDSHANDVRVTGESHAGDMSKTCETEAKSPKDRSHASNMSVACQSHANNTQEGKGRDRSTNSDSIHGIHSNTQKTQQAKPAKRARARAPSSMDDDSPGAVESKPPNRMVARFMDGAGDAFVLGELEKGIAVRLNKLQKLCGERGITGADVEAAGRALAGQTWRDTPMTAAQLAKGNTLLDLVALGRRPKAVDDAMTYEDLMALAAEQREEERKAAGGAS